MHFLPHMLRGYIPLESGHRREFSAVFLKQVFYTYNQSIAILCILGVISGIAVAFQAHAGLSLLGSTEQFGSLLALLLVRELTPVVASLLFVTRSVTAIASDLATKKVIHEVEALELMGINILHYLIAPRILAGVVSLFCMSVTFGCFAIIGSYIGSNWYSYIPPNRFADAFSHSLYMSDFVFFTLKSTIPGALAARLGCKSGLSLQKASFEVPIVTNKAVVDALTLVIVLHMGLSAIFYMIHGFNV